MHMFLMFYTARANKIDTPLVFIRLSLRIIKLTAFCVSTVWCSFYVGKSDGRTSVHLSLSE